MQKYSHYEAFKILSKFEKEKDIKKIKIDDIEIWPIVKFSIFRILTGTSDKKFNFLEEIKNRFKNYTLLNIVRSFFNLNQINSKKIFFSFPDSRRKINNFYYDILFDFDNCENFQILEWPSPKTHIKKSLNYKKIIFLDYLSLKIEIKTLFFSLFFKNNLIILKKYFNKHNINKVISVQYTQFILYKKEFENFFKKNNQIKEVIFKNSYTPRHQALCYVANSLKIKTVEYQHGIISKYHPGYIYFKKFNSKIFPSKLCVYGPKVKAEILSTSKQFKKSQISFHKQLKNIKTFHNSTKKEIIEKLKIIPNNKKIILITSQWINREEMRSILYIFIKYFSDLFFVLKTHPQEKDSKDFYKILSKHKNFKLVLEENVSVYDLYNIANFHSSFFSTCVFESLYWKIPNILFKNKDSENLSSLKNTYGINFVKNKEEFKKAINKKYNRDKIYKEAKKFYI